MNIHIQFWGITARIAGADSRRIELPAASTVADAIDVLSRDAALAIELLRCAYAVGTDMVSLQQRLDDGDELSVLPPVSGG